MPQSRYIGRFAPSPTGPLHLGSMACALASWLDARAHGGTWLVRIEDIDPPRDVPGADRRILDTLSAFDLIGDGPVLWQHDRGAAYEAALEELKRRGLAYGCACTRAEVAREAALRHLAPGVYPGTCRNGTGGRPIRAWRFRTGGRTVAFTDRRMGLYQQNVEKDVGDFVIRRADGLWAYQLAVVVDDAHQGVTHVVRGCDLIDNTPRQMLLQEALGLPTPEYLHIALVTDESGQKLSKQTHAAPVPVEHPLATLEVVGRHLGLPSIGADSLPAFLTCAVVCWREMLEAAEEKPA
ncbi:MAG: tRNA glutamyl-Q(34) synthetase GluQRS [Duodenibacillus sp.]